MDKPSLRGPFLTPVHRPLARTRLLCIPHAGGSAAVYYHWARQLDASVEPVAAQLPGRGHRLTEPPHHGLAELVADLTPDVARLCDKPLAIFGHSMGALVAFELVRALRRSYGIEPLCLFVAACPAPHLPRKERPIHELPGPLFWSAIRRLGGSPADVLHDQELKQLAEPVLRADFAVCETYDYVDEPPLGCALTAYRGLDDPSVGEAELAGWREQTEGRFSALAFPGGHFFPMEAKDALLAAITRDIHRNESRPLTLYA